MGASNTRITRMQEAGANRTGFLHSSKRRLLNVPVLQVRNLFLYTQEVQDVLDNLCSML